MVLLLSLFVLTPFASQATHIKAADITYKRVSDSELKIEFIITALTDTQSPVRFADGILDFGDGSSVQLDLGAESFIDGVYVDATQAIEVYTITISHTYSSPGVYTVYYIEPNRNDEIVNINQGNSVQTTFALQAMVVLDPSLGVNSSPVFNTLPADQAAIGKVFSHNGWATDPDGDSLSYRLVFPLQDLGQSVPNFNLPNDPLFYSNYQQGNEAANDQPSFQINPITGDLVWDAPGDLLSNTQGPFSEYTVAYIVEEWRQVDGRWVNIGYITRDMIIEVSDQITGRPDFSLPDVSEYTVGTLISETLTFTDPLDYQIKVETFGQLFGDETNPAQLSALSDDYDDGPLEASFEWTPQANQVSTRPYLIHLKITNQAPNDQSPLTTYKTWVLSHGPLPEVEIPRISTPPTTSNLVTSLFKDKVKKAKLFPNPVTGQLHFELENELQQIRELSVFNSLGQRTKWVVNPSYLITSVSVDDLDPGFYILELRTARAVYSGKFLKN